MSCQVVHHVIQNSHATALLLFTLDTLILKYRYLLLRMVNCLLCPVYIVICNMLRKCPSNVLQGRVEGVADNPLPDTSMIFFFFAFFLRFKIYLC